jgi:hypothetical protein
MKGYRVLKARKIYAKTNNNQLYTSKESLKYVKQIERKRSVS